jgi:putative oxidoreductase
MGVWFKELTTSIGLLILRLGMGGYMASHGWGKFRLLVAGEFEQFADPIGMGKTLSLISVVLAEFVCSLLVMIGLATRFAALPIVFAMGVAAFVVHANDPWTMGQGPASKEPALLFLLAFLTLVFTGAGKFSADGLICRRCADRPPQAS